MAFYDGTVRDYTSIAPFSAAFYETWLEGVFQFDLAALVPGDWTHIVALASYKGSYAGITSVPDGTPWMWQGEGEKVNGWRYAASAVLGYQMPLVLQMVALQAEFSGFYEKGSLDSQYHGWNHLFTTVALNPVFSFRFSDRQSLTVQISFKSRRSFEQTDCAVAESGLDGTYAGREWYFNRIAVSYHFLF